MALLPQGFSFSRKALPVIAAIGFIAAVLFIAFSLPNRELSEPEEQPARATGPLANAPRVAGAGVVEPSSEIIDVGTALSGLVTSLYVQPGDRVTKDQWLFTVDTRQIRAGLGEAQASVAEANASIADARSALATAQRQLDLYRSIDDPAAVSRAEVIRAEGEADMARQRLKLAQARLQSARARVNAAQTELGRASVRAPIAGEILAVNIREGEYLSTMGGQSQPFIQMGETQPLHVRIDIDEDEAGRIKQGAEAYVSPRGAAEMQVKATFVRAEPLVIPKRSLTNSAQERVDVRVLQLIYALPDSARESFNVGQQVDAFIPAKDGSK
ncbi:efflux RND transporter periplasmic adaptor subunit [Altererythrobacter arenosus]|uniref:Efflux RND transporter periplasmic adaptor subunit n=1 Tax=Altererythrobacter arenosus TaxID=3032592 RepID=A0ABY8FNZ0_9SPHN|nr:efflux RND transporter periplasmic adaptor subunit [Altererythrobacter sp. CAU 1644]WFL75985.1 efflux RND transporter periplasmic adaptor subunit [Altererythrobacter sp. CAU 1644]